MPVRIITALALSLALIAPQSVSAQWLDGVHYQRIEPVQEATGDRIEVIEVFWYGCPSCNLLEPHLATWLENKPDDVDFIRIAASLNPSWRMHARAFYTAETLGVVDAIHTAMFRAIHRQRQPMNDLDSLAKLFHDEAGVDKETFNRAMQGFGVETRTRRGDQLVRRYKITGTPTIIVNGKYRTGPVQAKGYPELIEVMEFLIEKERRANPASP